MTQELCYLFNVVSNSENVPDEWRKGMIVRLPKKGNLINCNYNGEGLRCYHSLGKFCVQYF